ncbi:2Fe-2S iron-sulfur cluster-binding protein [Haliea sp. E17]|uniref:2Fe-2S iron-sulfur cluster-binding protein n=1 Tax=Haliea sp. E17 TaxID=3401576 RepID=UPI003AB0AB72
MPTVKLTRADGQVRELYVDPTGTLMEAIRDANCDELLALCGGCLSCATCHVHVDPADFDRLAPMSEDENALLEGVDNRVASSRLSCQVWLDDSHEGIAIQLVETG